MSRRILNRFALASSCLLLACTGGRPVTMPTPRLLVSPPALAADLHAHFTMKDAARPLFRGEPGDGVLARSPSSRFENQLDEAQLKASGVRLAFAALWPPLALRPGRSALDEALGQVARLQEFVRRRPGFAVVRSAQ